MCTLVADLIPLILESQAHWWPRDLARLARISAAWLRPTQKLLYAHPVLRTYSACALLVRTLDATPTLAPLVRALDIQSSQNELGERRPCTTDVRRLLALTTLESLTIGSDLSQCPERFLRSVASPHTLTTLRIVASFREPTFLEWDLDLTQRFHALKKLELVGPTLDLAIVNPIYAESRFEHGFRLEELYLGNIDLNAGLYSGLQSSTKSWQNLRRLNIVATDFESHLDFLTLLTTPLSQLESFSLESTIPSPLFVNPTEDTTVPHLSFLPPFTTLRHVRLVNCQLLPEALPIIQHAFPNIESFELSDSRWTYFQTPDWAYLLRPPGLKRLRKLILKETRGDFSWGPSDLEMLCAERGVELLCDLLNGL